MTVLKLQLKSRFPVLTKLMAAPLGAPCTNSATLRRASPVRTVAPLEAPASLPAVATRPNVSIFGGRDAGAPRTMRSHGLVGLMSAALRIFAILACAASQAVSAAEAIIIERHSDPTKPIPISVQGYSGEVDQVLKFDLEVMGFEVVSPDKAQFVLEGSNNGAVEGRLTDRVTKSQLLGNRYQNATMRRQAHALADDVVLKVTGKPGIAQTTIAFVGRSGKTTEIYRADYDGANAVPVTKDGELVAAPAWAPGQTILYYTSYLAGPPDIYAQNVRTGARKAIAKYSGLNTSAAVSPDGRQVAMILSAAGSPDLYVADANGGNLRRLTKTREAEASPCWSPDGKTICVVSARGGLPALYLIPSGGGELRRLKTAGAGRVTEPEWSPDGRWIAFTAQWSRFQICIVPSEGGKVEVLAEGEDPSWAPNSRTLIFTRRKNGRDVLSLLDVPTKRVKDVGQISGSWSQPSWAK